MMMGQACGKDEAQKECIQNFDSRHLTKWEVISKNITEVDCSGTVKYRPWASNNNGHP